MREVRAPFIFLANPIQSVREQDLLVKVPTGIQVEADLLIQFEREGRFPAYFGRNWDALLDCLRDFSWVDQRRIVIVHNDLPLTDQQEDLRTYLEILETAVQDWNDVRQGPFAEPPPSMPYIEHELRVVFPSAVEETVLRVLRG